MSNVPKGLGHSDEKFLEALLADDDLIAVLRGHLYIETELNKLLEKIVPGCNEMLNELDFMQKAKVAKRMRLYGKPTMRSLQALGELRNDFAHELGRKITADDDAKIYGALHPHNKLFIDDYLKGAPEEDVPGVRTRLGIARLHVDMVAFSDLAPFAPGTYNNE